MNCSFSENVIRNSDKSRFENWFDQLWQKKMFQEFQEFFDTESKIGSRNAIEIFRKIRPNIANFFFG